MPRAQQQSSFEVNIGDLVELNSGGPLMKVTDIEGEIATVQWECVSEFPLACLRLSEQ
jgi:hypothetical protein